MEQVFVVERGDFFAGKWPQGFVSIGPERGRELVRSFERRGFFADRATAERTPAWKQLIPYCVVRRGGELFCARRLHRQSEGRLHGKYSIGFGGHVNPEDHGGPAAAPGLLRAALRRELDEELRIPRTPAPRPRFLGLLNDDATDVGSVHAGLVYLLEVAPGSRVEIRETTKMEGHFRALSDLLGGDPAAAGSPPEGRVVESGRLWQHSAFESWSAIMLEAGPWGCPGTPVEGSLHGSVSREESHDG